MNYCLGTFNSTNQVIFVKSQLLCDAEKDETDFNPFLTTSVTIMPVKFLYNLFNYMICSY